MKRLTLAILACAVLLPGRAHAEDTLKLTVGQRGNFATSVAEIGQRAGIFKKHGFNLDLTYTQGSGETQQAVIAGSVQIGVAVGTLGALGAYGKGAPIRIIGAETTGAGDLYWYVKKDSPIKTIKDYDGKTVAFSTIGSSTNGVVLAYIQQYGIKPKLVATGSPTATIVQVMSGQVDVGWAAPPDGLDQLDKGEIRVVSNGNDASIFKNQTVRVLAVNATYLKEHPDVVRRFMQAYRETVNAIFKDEAVLKGYADWLNISMAKAKRSRDDFYPFPALNPDTVIGLDAVMEDAVKLRFLQAPLTQAQLTELVQIQQP
jgi:NitT/TauT family transport system substrate-binding protein